MKEAKSAIKRCKDTYEGIFKKQDGFQGKSMLVFMNIRDKQMNQA